MPGGRFFQLKRTFEHLRQTKRKVWCRCRRFVLRNTEKRLLIRIEKPPRVEQLPDRTPLASIHPLWFFQDIWPWQGALSSALALGCRTGCGTGRSQTRETHPQEYGVGLGRGQAVLLQIPVLKSCLNPFFSCFRVYRAYLGPSVVRVLGCP